ncbi:MAG: non-canonical purine NTP pyrophosphatase, partial [Opitutaceae bacterium]|nr:non-canonical purine NTP pyrophosphatase [Opitutaceae bacterium]
MRLFLASNNSHKAAEFNALARSAGRDLEILPATAAGGMPDVAEDTGAFAGNARKKALALLPKLPPDAWALSDDSGICVDALGGGPGVESAYYAGRPGDSAANLAKLISTLENLPPGTSRRAHYHCHLCLLSANGAEHHFEGQCHGRLVTTPRGRNGFGYDPIFIPDGHAQT